MPTHSLSPGRLATLVRPALGSPGPAYLALAHAIRAVVSDGRVQVGTRLPSERALTAQLQVSRTTVTRAYDLLREQRYLESRQGSGSVARLPVPRSGRTDHLLIPRGSTDDSIDLTTAASSAPPGTVEAFEAAVEQLPGYLSGNGYYPTGLPALRTAVAERYAARGLPTDPEQVVVVAGALAGLAIAAQSLTRPGDRVLVESPTYPNPLSTLAARGTRLLATPVDPEHGWDEEGIASLAGADRLRMAYLIPDFHNPTGALMGDEVRARVAATLRRHRVVPVVDESLVDLALDDVVMPAPFGVHAPEAITVGSASKSFWGGLRVGWMRVPHDRVNGVTAARLSLDLACPLLEQLAVLHLLRHEQPVLDHRRSGAAASRRALLDALRTWLPDWSPTPGHGGLSVWCRLPAPLSSALSVTAERHGVYLPAGPAFAPEGGLEHYVRLPHTLPPETLVEAVQRLARAWAQAPDEDRRAAGRAPVVA